MFLERFKEVGNFTITKLPLGGSKIIIDLKDIHKTEEIIHIHEHKKINFVIILPNVRKRTLKKHTVAVKESFNFNKGNVN